jgi:hypothetical protein
MLSLSTRSRDPALSEFVGGRGRPRQPRFTDAKAGEEQVRRFAWLQRPLNELVGDVRAFYAGLRT